MKRRDFLKTVGFGTAALAVSGERLCSAAGARAKRPNILWICVEDMSANMSCYGETAIETLKKARNEDYEYVKRVSTRIVNTLEKNR